jgi:hypothetical protein
MRDKIKPMPHMYQPSLNTAETGTGGADIAGIEGLRDAERRLQRVTLFLAPAPLVPGPKGGQRSRPKVLAIRRSLEKGVGPSVPWWYFLRLGLVPSAIRDVDWRIPHVRRRLDGQR